jgi:hypothetical protein
MMEERGLFTEKKFSLGKWFQQSAYGLTSLMKWAKGDITDDQINLDDPTVTQSVNNQDNKYKRTALIYACRSLQPIDEILRKVKILIAMGADINLAADEFHEDDLSKNGLHVALDYIRLQKGESDSKTQIIGLLTTDPPSVPVTSSSA